MGVCQLLCLSALPAASEDQRSLKALANGKVAYIFILCIFFSVLLLQIAHDAGLVNQII